MSIKRQSCYCTKPLTPLPSNTDDRYDPIDTNAIGFDEATVINNAAVAVAKARAPRDRESLFIKRLSHRFLKKVSLDDEVTKSRRQLLPLLLDWRRRSHHSGTSTTTSKPVRYSYYDLLDPGREPGKIPQVRNHEPRRRLMLGRFVVLALGKPSARLSTASTLKSRSKLPESVPLLPLLRTLLRTLLPLLDSHLFELVSLVSLNDHHDILTVNTKAANATMTTISMSTLALDGLEHLKPPPRNPQRLLKGSSMVSSRPMSFSTDWLRSLLSSPRDSQPTLLPPQGVMGDTTMSSKTPTIPEDPTTTPETEEEESGATTNDETNDDTSEDTSEAPTSNYLKIKLFVYDRHPQIYRIKVNRDRIHDRYDLQMAILIRLMEKRLLFLELERLKLSIFFKNPKLPQVVFKDPEESEDQCELLKVWRDELVMEYVRVKERINVRVTQQPKYIPPLPQEAFTQVASTNLNVRAQTE